MAETVAPDCQRSSSHLTTWLEIVRSLYRSLLRWFNVTRQIHALSLHGSLETLRNAPRYQAPKNLIRYGDKVYSQNQEDGMIREIFNRIGVTNKLFVEFGVGDGLENNTFALLFDGWKGQWIEADEKSARQIREHLKKTIATGALKVTQAYATKDNINDLISAAIDQEEIDLLSIDIDGNDAYVFNAITCIKPRVVVIEYNAKFTPPILFCVDYDATRAWEVDDFFGASLKFLEVEFRKKGYLLVGCDLTGTNAFFVREDLVGDHFLEPFTAEHHYEPARYHLAGFPSGHTASYKALEESQHVRPA